MIEYNLSDTLEWSSVAGTTLEIQHMPGGFIIKGECGRISAAYPVVGEPTPQKVGDAVYATLYSIMHGTEFHNQNGFFPKIEDKPFEKTEGVDNLIPPLWLDESFEVS